MKTGYFLTLALLLLSSGSNKSSTIRVKESTKAKIISLNFVKKNTYDEILTKLVEFYEKYSKNDSIVNKKGNVELISALLLFALLASIILVSAITNERINKTITINLSYKSGTIYDENDDGVETVKGVIDLTVENSLFNWQPDESKLCTRWEVYSHENETSSFECYGSNACCAFVDLLAKTDNWEEIYYSTYGKDNAGLNNTIAAKIIYYNVSLNLENLYAEIISSELANLTAKYYFENNSITNETIPINRTIGNETIINKTILKINETLELNLTINETLNITQNFNITINKTLNITKINTSLINITNLSENNISKDFQNITSLNETGFFNWTRTITNIYGNKTEEIVMELKVPKNLKTLTDQIENEEIKINRTKNNKKTLRALFSIFSSASSSDKENLTLLKQQLKQELKDKYPAAKLNSNKGPIKNIKFNDISIINDTISIGIEEISDSGFAQSYAIDPTNLNFTNATVTVTAKGTELYKCKDWNFTQQSCYGEWELFKTELVPGEEYTFTLTPEDPAFGEINITAARHLDENYSFISNIYDEVKEKDGVWSEPIYSGEFVRVIYEKNLTNGNVIDVVVRNVNQTNTSFKVYNINTTSPVLGSSGIIDSAEGEWVYITLNNVAQLADTFDFKIIGDGFLEFDYIHDAPPNLTSVILNSTLGTNFTSENLTANIVGLDPSNASVQYDWYKNSALSAVFLGNATSQNTIPNWFTTAGETWQVNATPKVLTNNYDISLGVFNDLFSVAAQEIIPKGMAFNNDGTKLYVIGAGGDDINEYNLSTPFDVSTGVFNDLFSISAQDTSPQGMAFNNDGTKLYVVGNTGDDISEYDLSTPFDVSTGTFVDTFSVGAQEVTPTGMAFNNDGTKLYVIGQAGDDINEYDLSIAFDVSTGTFVDTFSVGAQETVPIGMAFNNDGTKLYVIGSNGDDVNEYNLSTAFDVSTGVFNDLFSISAQEITPQGMAFNNDGTKLYVIGQAGDDINEYDVGSVESGLSVLSNNLTVLVPKIDSVILNSSSGTNFSNENLTAYPINVGPSEASVQYDWYKDGALSAVFLGNATFQNTIPNWFTTAGETWQVNATPKVLTNNYDVSTGTFVDNFNVSAQETAPKGMAFNNDGTKLYVIGSNGVEVNEYNLSTAFDVSTGTFVDNFSISAQETAPTGMAFNNDGTKLYVVGATGDDVNEYDLSTPFDVSTGTFVDTFSVSAQEVTPQDVVFNNDGTKLYVLGASGDDVNEYDLSTPFDVSTGTFVDTFSVSAQETSPTGMAFNNDGTKLYVIGFASDNVNEYDLSTPFDVSTGTFVDTLSVLAQESISGGMEFNNDGTKLYVIGTNGVEVNEYDVGSVESGVGVLSNNLTILELDNPPSVTNVTALNLGNFNSTTNVLIQANVTDDNDISSVYASVLYPDLSTRINLTMLDGDSDSVYDVSFFDHYQKGNYNITIVATDNANQVNDSLKLNFNRIIANGIIDFAGDSPETSLSFDVTILNNNSGILDLNLGVIDAGNLQNLVIFGYDSNSVNSTLRGTNNTDVNGTEGFEGSFAIDPTRIVFDNMTITVTAFGAYLLKCSNFSFENQSCSEDAEYALLKSNLTIGKNYTFVLTSEDPGFAEVIEGPGNIKDSFIIEDAPENNNGVLNRITVGTGSVTNNNRGIIEFDLSSIPRGAEINNAQLKLYYYKDGSKGKTRNQSIHKVLESWNEGNGANILNDAAINGTTWNARWLGTNWTNLGGYFNSTATHTIGVGTATGEYVVWNVTSDLANIAYNNFTNSYGWVIKDETEGVKKTKKFYRSKAVSAESERPILLVDYTFDPATVEFVSPRPITYNYQNISVEIANNSKAVSVWWSNGTVNLTYSGPIIYNFSNMSTHTLRTYANDSFGNVVSSSVIFSVDTSAPPADNIAPGIEFLSFTPENNAVTANTFFQAGINITNASDLNRFIWNFNDTDFIFYDSDLIMMYDFDNASSLGENDNSIKDASLVNGSSTCTTCPAWKPDGIYQGYFNYSGNGKFVTDFVIFNLSSGTFSIESWLRWDSGTETGVILGDAGPGQNFAWQKGDDGGIAKLYLAGGGIKNEYFDNTTAVFDGSWHHVVLASDSGTVYVYVDGMLKDSSTAIGATPTSTGLMQIGERSGDSNRWKGGIDSLKIYKKTLLSNEVLQHYFSNLRKYDADKWIFESNQSGLGSAVYSYFSNARDSYHNSNQTETRAIAIDFVFPTVNLVSPADNFSSSISDPLDVTFECNATDNHNLANISLYITNSSNSSFSLNSTASISGTSNSTTNILSLTNGTYTWNCLAYDSAGNSDWGDNNRTLKINHTVIGNLPQITQVQPIGAITLSQFTVKTVEILFNVTDLDGFSNLNNSKSYCSLSKSGEATRNSTNCAAQDQSGNDLVYNCTLDMFFYDAAGLWNISCYAEDISGNNAINNAETATVNELNFVTQDSTSLNWTSLTPGNEDEESLTPIIFANGGNKDYTNFNITSQNATFGSNIIPNNQFLVDNETNQTLGQIRLNDSGINWNQGSLPTCAQPCSSNSTEIAHFYVDTPSGILSGVYTSISNWVISLS